VQIHKSVVPALAVVMLLLAACGAAPSRAAPSSPAATLTASPAPSGSAGPSYGPARLEVPETLFGMNLDWGNDSAAAVSERLGVTPAVWVQFTAFPWGDGDRGNLDAFYGQVASVGGMALVTLEPNDGLAAVTDAAIAELATLVAAWAERGVPTYVRFAHEMNGSWYAWAQQPSAYVAAFRRVAAALHAATPLAATVWAPNYGAGYPFAGGAFEAAAGSPELAEADTDGDGALTVADDPYAPYYPGDEAVDWVGMSLYHWGNVHPWGENEVPEAGAFADRLRGTYAGANGDETVIPDFYATYADGHDKPLAITETAALYDPAGDGPPEREVKEAWWREVFAPDVREAFPRMRMINWFEWRKDEAEVGRVIDWRMSADPELAAALLGEVPAGWLRFAGAAP
jgi:hypothetical protein